MWPKAFAQLVELAPHISRLLPMADRFFQSKAASDDASRRTMESVAEGLRGDLGQIAAAQADLARQFANQNGNGPELAGKLAELTSKIDDAAADARAARSAAVAAEQRIASIEARQIRTVRLLGIALLLLAAVLILLLIAVVHVYSRVP